MSKKANSQKQLVATSGKLVELRPQESSNRDFGRKLLFHPDAALAANIITEQAGFEFDSQHGLEMKEVEFGIEELNPRYDASASILSGLEEKRANTKRFVKTSAYWSKDNTEKPRWKDWQVKDKGLFVFCLLALIVCLGMGATNVYSNLIASGTPVFIESPWLAMFLSALVPTGSAAVKFVTNFMDYATSRRRYALCIYGLTVLVLIAWSVLFAKNFTGVAGSIDWSALGESDDSGTLFVWTQLFAEMLVGSCLFLTLEDIYTRYSPDLYIENLEYIEVDRAIREHLVTHEKCRDERSRLHGRLVELTAARQAYMNDKLTDYLSLRSRVATLSNFNN